MGNGYEHAIPMFCAEPPRLRKKSSSSISVEAGLPNETKEVRIVVTYKRP